MFLELVDRYAVQCVLLVNNLDLVLLLPFRTSNVDLHLVHVRWIRLLQLLRGSSLGQDGVVLHVLVANIN